MGPTEEKSMRPLWRGRLILALVILSALAVLSAVGVGETLHGWSETLDSLDHWKARHSEESGPANGFDAPAARIRRLEEELDALPERLFARGAMFLFSSLLVVLGARKLSADHRTEIPGGTRRPDPS